MAENQAPDVEVDLDELLEEALEGGGSNNFSEDYVTSSKKDGDLVPKGTHAVNIGYVKKLSTNSWAESVGIVLKMDDTKRGWWDNLNFATVDGDAEVTNRNIRASMEKLLALGFTKDEVKQLVRERKNIDWPQLLDGKRLKVRVAHNDSKGVTYANTYWNGQESEAATPTASTVSEAPAPAGEGNPMPSSLPTLG